MTQPRPLPPDQTFRDLTQNLLARTRAKEVNWVKSKGSGVGNSAFEVVLPHSRIIISFHSPEADPDYYVLHLQNSERVTAGSWEVEDFRSNQTPTSEADWQLVSDLYTEAHRIGTCWDTVLNDVQAALRRPGRIGSSRVSSGVATMGDEDIPF